MSIKQLLNSAGLRHTEVRKKVMVVLNEVDRPLSHQEIAGLPEMRDLDRVTLYRTLTTLEKAGLLHRIQGIDGVWRFRCHGANPGRCGGNHLHFFCLHCNQMSCLPEQPLPWVESPEGAKILSKQLIVYGYCTRCNRKTNDNPGEGCCPRPSTPPRDDGNETEIT